MILEDDTFAVWTQCSTDILALFVVQDNTAEIVVQADCIGKCSCIYVVSIIVERDSP